MDKWDILEACDTISEHAGIKDILILGGAPYRIDGNGNLYGVSLSQDQANLLNSVRIIKEYIERR